MRLRNIVNEANALEKKLYRNITNKQQEIFATLTNRRETGTGTGTNLNTLSPAG